MINIVLIGAGKLGSRHLQALAKIAIESKIYLVETKTLASKYFRGSLNSLNRICKYDAFLVNIVNSIPK